MGTVLSAQPLEGARVPAYRMEIDFGPHGVKGSSAQAADLYSAEDLVGRQVVALVDLDPKRIAGFVSEVLVLGVPSPEGTILLSVERNAPNGAEVF